MVFLGLMAAYLLCHYYFPQVALEITSLWSERYVDQFH